MTRHIIPGTNIPIYVLSKDQDELDSDIEALEDMLDKIENEVHMTRAALAIIKDNKHEFKNPDGPIQPT